jgi:Protein tyrosine and serine/threonine kinase
VCSVLVYSAPEVKDRERLVCASDTFSFGAVLWQLFSGTPPFTLSLAGDVVQAPDFPTFPDHAPFNYAVLALACMAPEPGERPPFFQAYEVLAALEGELGSGTYVDWTGHSGVRGTLPVRTIVPARLHATSWLRIAVAVCSFCADHAAATSCACALASRASYTHVRVGRMCSWQHASAAGVRAREAHEAGACQHAPLVSLPGQQRVRAAHASPLAARQRRVRAPAAPRAGAGLEVDAGQQPQRQHRNLRHWQ